MKSNRFLFLIAGVAGGCALSLELTASRLLAPVFGTSMIVWSAIISSTLVYLTVGYWFGGWVADRFPKEALLYKIIGGASLLTGLIPFISHPVIQWGWKATTQISPKGILGSFIVLILLFALPVALFGSVSPFVLRLVISNVTSSGKTAGKLSAISTIGSLIGALLPAFLFVPFLGTRYTFLVISIIAMCLALYGFIKIKEKKFSLFLLILTFMLVFGFFIFRNTPIIESNEIVYEKDSIYNYIQVIAKGKKEPKTFYLRLNESQHDHSIYREGEVFTNSYWDFSLITPFLSENFNPFETPIKQVAIIGGACGTISKIYTSVFGNIPIDHVEIDPDITKIAYKFFNLHEPNIYIYNEDGRAFLAKSTKKYDVVIVDAYQVPYIPFHLTTYEFFKIMKNRMSENGSVMLNTLRIRESPNLFKAICKTMKEVFPSVYVVELFYGRRVSKHDMGNTLIFATASPTNISQFKNNIEKLKNSEWFSNLSNNYQMALKKIFYDSENLIKEFNEDGIVLTDDNAPVEWMVHESLFNWIKDL